MAHNGQEQKKAKKEKISRKGRSDRAGAYVHVDQLKKCLTGKGYASWKCSLEALSMPQEDDAILVRLLSKAPLGVPEPLDNLNEVTIGCSDGALRHTTDQIAGAPAAATRFSTRAQVAITG